ncbi:MAG TPA: RsmB/NOP family class I SAM-dependent RNA methyltransferase, partial [Allosphingosinicella sp.]|nr:RsmB/NOP family class I SAM-dependent RNA methyltransferase [Allosphingosinicella sp.]
RPVSGRAALLGLAEQEPALLALFDGSPHAPAPPAAAEPRAPAGAAAGWLSARFDPLIGEGELAALLDRAPLDLRVNRLKGGREQALVAFPGAEPTPLSPLGLRLPHGARVEDSPAWRTGLVEVQDEGSQLVALACRARPGATVIDLCAGAGGKTLALAAEMGDDGRIVACDSDRGRLARMRPRLARAGVTIAEARMLDPGREREELADLTASADLVLVDAPCSGTGTWRRNPEARWRLTPERLSPLIALQARLLDLAAELARPGGHIVYAVCSLLAEEGRGQAEGFEARRSGFVSDCADIDWGRASGPGRLLSPAHDRTDGFFIARWQAPC